MAEQEIESLTAQINAKKQENKDTTLKESSQDQPWKPSFKTQRQLRGHISKVVGVQFAQNSSHVLSAAQDGFLIVWDAKTGTKEHHIELYSIWVMACAISPNGNLVASGGMLNEVSVFKVGNRGAPMCNLSGHDGLITGLSFTSDRELISCSGDQSAILWNVETQTNTSQYWGHDGGLTCVDASSNGNVIATGGCDKTVKLWDIRSNQRIATMYGHKDDVNAVRFFPDGNAVASASDDTTCRLYDLRALQEVQLYTNDVISAASTSLAFSKSGRLMFAGYANGVCEIWDVLEGRVMAGLEGHTARISGVDVSTDGQAVCTSSWDETLRVWA